MVITLKEKPDEALLKCSERPMGFSPVASAKMAPEMQATLKRVGTAFGATADQLDALINWLAPEKCPAS